MAITERTLRSWRTDALRENQSLEGWDSNIEQTSHRRETNDRILRLTQELLDQLMLIKSYKPKVQKQEGEY
jgi:hypothetical protein